MATNDIGRVTPIWRGFYSAATTYELNDIVIDTAGSVWWHKSEEITTGVAPGSGEIWDAVIDMSIFSGLIQAAITTAQTALAAAQAALADVAADMERAETAADNAENSAAAASESAAGVGALAQAAERSAEAAAGSATGAAGSAQAAAGSKSDAEAYAVGTRGGEDVGSTDPTYHNNAKYYAEQAGSSAEAAAQSAEDAQDVLDSIPEDYSQLSADVGDLKTQINSIATFGGTSAQMIDPTKYVDGYRWDTTLGSDIDTAPVEASGWTIVDQKWFIGDDKTVGFNYKSENIIVLGYKEQNGSYVRTSYTVGNTFESDGTHYKLTLASNISAIRVYVATNWHNGLSTPLIMAINEEWDGNPDYGTTDTSLKPDIDIPQVDELRGEVNADIIDLQKLDLGTLVDGFVNSQYGSFVEASTYKRTGKLPICGKTLIVTVTASAANVGMAFYDENKNFIPGSGVDFSEYTLGTDITVSVPQAARYVAYCAINAEADSMMILFPNYADAISQLVETIQSDSTAKANAAIQTISTLSLGTLEDGYINSSSGAAMPGSSYKRTGFIHMQADKLKVAITFSVASVGFAFYDSRKKYISGFDYTGYNVGDLKEVDVPDNAYYFRYCAVNANVSLMRVLIPNYANAVSRIDANPCFYDGSSECRTFKKILCIGDSLTAGQFDYKDDGVTKEFNAPEYSYPAFLKAMTGRDTTNAGDAGETTVSWYELHGQEDFSGHDACIIMLGRNDYVSGRETTSEERATAFANIISKVRTDNPQIPIFMATLINYYTGDGANTMNTDIRTAATGNNCYLLDISAYGRMVLADDAYSHCTAEGYCTLAEYFFRYISYIMHNNYTQFKTIQFVGTDRSYT